MNLSTLNMQQTKDDVVSLRGGFNQMTPTLDLSPGAAREMVNFECSLNGGYTRIAGYERYDGRTSPSSVTFKLLPIVSFVTVPTVGQTVVGGTSGATGVVIAVTASYIAVTRVLVSVFLHNEMISTSGGNIVGVTGVATTLPTKKQNRQYIKAASDVYRALIAAVPGIGPIRGVVGAIFNGKFEVYAFRDYVLDPTITSVRIWRATPAGWAALDLGVLASLGAYGMEVEYFNGSGPEPAKGDVWDYFGSTYVIHRVIVLSGTWAGGTAAGRIIFGYGGTVNPGLPGAFSQTYNPHTYNGSTFSTRMSATYVRLVSGGKFEFAVGNFGGQLSETKIYGCDGVNRAFEFDGRVITPITTGIEQLGWTLFGTVVTKDKPTHIAVHHNHLFLSIGSSVFNSAIGNPFNWEAGLGAGEIATGDQVTGMQVLPGTQQNGALAIFARNHTKVLYGTALAGNEPFDLVSFGADFGAMPYTMLQMQDIYFLDDRGVMSLKTAQEFGNFAAATVTQGIQRFINGRTGRAIFALLNRTKGQYRLFFNDGTGLYITFLNGKLMGISRVAFERTWSCGWSGENAGGIEQSFIGGTDGYVYQLDRGTSFDGDVIEALLIPNWNTLKSPRVRKSFRKMILEVHEAEYAEMSIAALLGPETNAHLQDNSEDVTPPFENVAQWDHFTWDNFYWDAHGDAPIEMDVKGTADRVQWVIRSISDYLEPFTLSTIITRYALRRGLR